MTWPMVSVKDDDDNWYVESLAVRGVCAVWGV